jgi:hypothetical protein
VLFQSAAVAQMTMDAFPAWDGHAVFHRWMPWVIEISNKGSPINGLIEVVDDSSVGSRLAMITAEVPSQTNKRFWIYVPSPGFQGGKFKVRLLNERLRKIYEFPVSTQMHHLPCRLVAESIPSTWLKLGLRGQEHLKTRPEWFSTRILKQHLPDAAVGYDGLDALHLGWSEMSDLSSAQRQALLDWVGRGGHLVASAEDSNAWRSDPWWGEVLPVSVESQQPLASLDNLGAWLTAQQSLNLNQAQPPMSPSETLVGVGKLVRGKILIQQGDLPLIAQCRRGRGTVTQLLFNPGRDPFRNWNGKSAFWTFLLQGPREYYDSLLDPAQKNTDEAKNITSYEHRNLQANALENFSANVFQTNQQRDLPWILLGSLMVGYIILIGPFDYIFLKRRRKFVWTWITFPSYVIGTTLVVYYLGYWTNAGESEWRQWTVLDSNVGENRQHGLSVARFYSSRNSEYSWKDSEGIVTQVREMDESTGAGSSLSSRFIVNTPSGTKVTAAVPVWTSSMFAARFDQSSLAIEGHYDRDAGSLKITNPTKTDWVDCRWAEPLTFRRLGDVKAGETKTWNLKSIPVENLNAGDLPSTLTYVNRQFGLDNSKRVTMDMVQGVCFAPSLVQTLQMGSVGEGMDLVSTWQEGDGLFLANSDVSEPWPWDLNFKPVRKRFSRTYRIYFSDAAAVSPSLPQP